MAELLDDEELVAAIQAQDWDRAEALLERVRHDEISRDSLEQWMLALLMAFGAELGPGGIRLVLTTRPLGRSTD